MDSNDSLPRRKLLDLDVREIAAALATAGLWFDLGAAVLRVRSRVLALAQQLQMAYRHYPFVPQAPWADLHVQLDTRSGIRRWSRRQVIFRCDGAQPFDPFPVDSPLPMLEWGSNWLIGRRLGHLLLLHAGAVEKGGRVLLMPATPGSGKSTLTAALSLRGWRLLSDEFGAFDPADRVFHALLKPVALKNDSISLIRDFSSEACFGPEFPKTRKGTVAHLAATRDSVERRRDPSPAGAIVLPRWRAGSRTRFEPVEQRAIFGALAFNSFNYSMLGATGFDAVMHLARSCPAWQLIYSDLDEAVAAVDGIWPEVVAEHLATDSARP